jgi:nucleoside-diphosphate-sugar epimerase
VHISSSSVYFGEERSGPPLTRYAVMHLSDDHTLDITRARALLGYAPRWTFRDGPLM